MKKINCILCIAFLILITSCNNSQKKTDDVLKVGVMASMDYLPLAVAQREGYFQKVGLNIEIQKFYSANERDAAFQSNNIDGCIIDFTGAMLQKSGGIDLKLTSKCDAPFYIVAGAKSNVNTLSELKGKGIAVSQNTVIDFIVDMALQSGGLTADDVKKVEVNKIPLRFELLRNSKIDATGLPNPFALMAQAAGDKILTSNDNLGFAITGIMFHKLALEKKNEQIQKMYEAYNMGVEYIKTHSVTDIKDILTKDFAFPAQLVDNAQLPQYTPAQLPTNKDLEICARWLQNKKLIDERFDINTLLDGQFIK